MSAFKNILELMMMLKAFKAYFMNECLKINPKIFWRRLKNLIDSIRYKNCFITSSFEPVQDIFLHRVHVLVVNLNKLHFQCRAFHSIIFAVTSYHRGSCSSLLLLIYSHHQYAIINCQNISFLNLWASKIPLWKLPLFWTSFNEILAYSCGGLLP